MVKFIGNTYRTDVWLNQNSKREYRVTKNRVFNTAQWGGSESVLTAKGEWICDTDSKFFETNFEVMSI